MAGSIIEDREIWLWWQKWRSIFAWQDVSQDPLRRQPPHAPHSETYRRQHCNKGGQKSSLCAEACPCIFDCDEQRMELVPGPRSAALADQSWRVSLRQTLLCGAAGHVMTARLFLDDLRS